MVTKSPVGTPLTSVSFTPTKTTRAQVGVIKVSGSL
nr:hypothetical protein [Tanacetum cinerariifolium]